LVKHKRYSSYNSSNLSSTVLINKQIKPLDVTSPKVVKSLVKNTGKIKNILNDNFGLIEFYQDDGKPTFCLFDTYDLYLEGGKTAAQSKLTVSNVLALDMEVCFHACEMSPGSSVPWLANGVWRPDVTSHPKPVPYSRVTKEKVAVFMKVAESCALLVTAGVSLAPHTVTGKVFESSGETVEEKRVHEVDKGGLDPGLPAEENVGQDICVAPVKIRKDEVEENESNRKEANLDEDESNQKEGNSVNESSINAPEVKIKNEMNSEHISTKVDRIEPERNVKKLATEETVIKLPLKEEVADEVVLQAVGNKLETENSVNVKKSDDLCDQDTSKQAELTKESNVKEDLTTDILALSYPESLFDNVTLGTMSQALSQEFAIVTLNCPVGTKALLHCDRVWVTDKPMRMMEGAESDWEELTKASTPGLEGIRINARKVQGFDKFEYQVTFAHIGVGAFEGIKGKSSYTQELAEFARTKEEVEMLDKQLNTFRIEN